MFLLFGLRWVDVRPRYLCCAIIFCILRRMSVNFRGCTMSFRKSTNCLCCNCCRKMNFCCSRKLNLCCMMNFCHTKNFCCTMSPCRMTTNCCFCWRLRNFCDCNLMMNCCRKKVFCM